MIGFADSWVVDKGWKGQGSNSLNREHKFKKDPNPEDKDPKKTIRAGSYMRHPINSLGVDAGAASVSADCASDRRARQRVLNDLM